MGCSFHWMAQAKGMTCLLSSQLVIQDDRLLDASMPNMLVLINWIRALLPTPPTVLMYPQNWPLYPYLTYGWKWVKVGRDCVANVPAPPNCYYYYFFFSRFFSVPLCFHLKFCSVSFSFLSFILSLSLVVVVPLPVCITFIFFKWMLFILRVSQFALWLLWLKVLSLLVLWRKVVLWVIASCYLLSKW